MSIIGCDFRCSKCENSTNLNCSECAFSMIAKEFIRGRFDCDCPLGTVPNPELRLCNSIFLHEVL